MYFYVHYRGFPLVTTTTPVGVLATYSLGRLIFNMFHSINSTFGT